MRTSYETMKEQEQETEIEKENIFYYIVVGIVILLFTTTFIVAMDFIIMDSMGLNNVLIKSDISFNIPGNYTILTDGKCFIIKNGKDEYLYRSLDNIKATKYTYIFKPARFFNEGKAKGYLKKYLKQNNPTKDFKPINSTNTP